MGQDCETTETYFLWGCELSRKNDSYVLPFPDADSDSAAEMEDHVLTIKSLTLGVDAQEKDRNVVESLQSLTVDEEYEPDASSAEDVSDASGMETEGDEVEADEIKDLKEDEKKAEEEKAKEEKK